MLCYMEGEGWDTSSACYPFFGLIRVSIIMYTYLYTCLLYCFVNELDTQSSPFDLNFLFPVDYLSMPSSSKSYK